MIARPFRCAPRLPAALLQTALLPAALLSAGGPAAAQVRLTGLSDMAFGALSTTANDAVQSQTVCAYAAGLPGAYSIRASGSGAGGALTLAGNGAPLPYEVQWAGAPGRSSGIAIPANTDVGGFNGGIVPQLCTLLTGGSATLIVILRADALGKAGAGSYAGTLTLIMAAQ